jgi:predicted glycoside hydrolase/deacetylase ChbG (UPF0249 family)
MILSVDDLGLCRKNDLALVTSLDAAWLDRVSVMTGFGGLTHLMDWLNRVPALDLHLNLTEPASRPDKRGSPSRRTVIAQRLRFVSRIWGRNAPARAEHIWRSQIEAFKARFGRYPDGLNSHEHIHLFPPYFKRVASLAHQYGIAYIRLGEVPASPHDDWRSLLFDRFHKANLKTLKRGCCTTSRALYSYDCGRYSAQSLPGKLQPASEIIFHPDMSADMDALGILVSNRENADQSP